MSEKTRRDYVPFPIRGQLHTDVLEERYGPVHAEVQEHTDDRRIVDIVDASGVSRTHAITLFGEWCDREKLSEIDTEIRSGGLIGKTFRDHGYTIRKHVTGVSVVNIPDWLRIRFNTEDQRAKARTSEFFARRGLEEPLIYGNVTEIYTPDFRPAEINDTDQSQVSATTQALEEMGVTRDIIWKSIVEEATIDPKILEAALQASKNRMSRDEELLKVYLRQTST